ncbi:phage tail tip lysozyme [Oricola sp.]|uniref:phage tail tip lysozyme n=1 Tax=Oricola sp. TaxID=1979950 RepID=UPI0025CBC3C9|nr:phage tail tip lysozyme [Oricola sp.]MCI5075643.1 phage tail tip lysozyme [Oricola sp.]
MAREIPTFDARAPRRGSVAVNNDTGAVGTFQAIASAAGQISGRLANMAAKAAKREGAEAGAAAAMQVSMPGVDFAFPETGPAASSGDTAARIRDRLVRVHGFAPHAAQAVAGHAQAESAGRPDASGDAGTAIGLFQWRGERARQLETYAASRGVNWKDTDTQIDFVVHELKTTERYAGLQLAGAADVESAVAAFMHFERPQGYSRADPRAGHNFAGRLAFAQGLGHTTGKRTVSGRPTYVDPNGGEYSEKTVTFPIGDQWYTFPSVDELGNIQTEDEVAEYVKKHGPIDPITGEMFPVFASREKAEDYAKRRSASRLPGGTSGAATADGGVRVSLTGTLGGIPQMQGGTIRADAYNQAAMDIALNRFDTSMRAQMDALALQHEGDPSALGEALDGALKGYVEGQPAKVAASITESFERNRVSLMSAAARRYQDRLEEEHRVSFEAQIASRKTSLIRTATTSDVTPESDAAIAGELRALRADIAASGLPPTARERLLRETEQDVVSARIVGRFDQIDDPAERAAYLQEFQGEWAKDNGFGGRLDERTYDKVNAELIRRVEADELAAERRATAVTKQINGQISILKKGLPVPEDQRRALSQAAAETGGAALTSTMDFLDGLADWQRAHVAVRPQVVAAQIDAMRARMMQDGANESALTTLDVMEGLHKQMIDGLRDDPLSWAQTAGVATIEPIDFSDDAALTASLAERVNDAEAVASHYGVAPRYFTPAEADALKKAVQDNPLQLPGIVAGLTAGLGEATPAALAEISKDAPVLAHLGGLFHATGNQRLAVEIAEALHMRAQDGYKSPLPSNAKLESAAAEATGAAFYAQPQLRNAVMRTANVLFERRIAALGIDASDFGNAGNMAREAYQQAIDEVLGATERNGVKYGGLTMVNGVETIAPPDMRADALEGLIRNISESDLASQMATGSINGVPISVRQMQRAVPVNVGQGLYRLALGDPYSEDPRYVPALDGGYFVLDASRLAERRRLRFPAPDPSSPFMKPVDVLAPTERRLGLRGDGS